jgi:hypothetical protein
MNREGRKKPRKNCGHGFKPSITDMRIGDKREKKKTTSSTRIVNGII